jgi:hypothetical protein
MSRKFPSDIKKVSYVCFFIMLAHCPDGFRLV